MLSGERLHPEVGGPVDRCCYLPRDVFFGRLGFAGVFFTAWAGDFGRFLPARSDSFPLNVLPACILSGEPPMWRGWLPSGAFEFRDRLA